MFTFQVEPWDQVWRIKITTLHADIELEEGEEFIRYEVKEYGRQESVEYRFKLKKRGNYKEYLKMFVELNVGKLNLKDLVGVMSFFREVHQYVSSLYRRGTAADLTFRWRDRDISVEFALYASKGEDRSEVLSKLKAEYGGEHILLMRSEEAEDAEECMKNHTEEAVGLYMLFKEYVAQEQEPQKT